MIHTKAESRKFDKSKSDMIQKVLILGGAGKAGSRLAKYLIKYTKDFNVKLIGRNEQRLKQTIDNLLPLCNIAKDRVSFQRLDVENQMECLFPLIKDHQTIVNFLPELAEKNTRSLIEFVINNKCDWIDAQFSKSTTNILKSYDQAAKKEGVCIVTQGGYHPGLPALMVREASLHLKNIESAYCFGMLRMKGKSKMSY